MAAEYPLHIFRQVSLTPPDDCSYCGYKGKKLPEGYHCMCCGYYKPHPEDTPLNGTFFIICYPNGDTSKLHVAQITRGMEYEKSDYALASRHDFDTREEAHDAAVELARKHGKTYTGTGDHHNFLD